MLNDIQNRIFDGSMLGDGCIVKNFTNNGICHFEKMQSKYDYIGVDKMQFMEWHKLNFDDFNSTIHQNTAQASGLVSQIYGDKIYERYLFSTKSLKFWEKMESKWYTSRTDHYWFKRRKIIPNDLKLTPLTLCIWHMDDGSNSPKDANIELNTQGFTPEEVDFLIERLKQDLGIESKRKVSGIKDIQFKIYIGRKYYFEFIEMIKPHVAWNCFQYKLDATTYNKLPNKGETHAMAKMTELNVKEVFALRKTGMFHKEIAEKLNISSANISMILSGARWSHIEGDRTNNKKPRISAETKSLTRELSSQGLFQKDIAEQLNITQASVSRILRKNQCHV